MMVISLKSILLIRIDQNWMEVIKLERSLSDMNASQERRKSSFQNFRAASSCNLK